MDLNSNNQSLIGLKAKTESLTDNLLATLFPYHLSKKTVDGKPEAIGIDWEKKLRIELMEVLSYVMRTQMESTAEELMNSLSEIGEMLRKDITAAYQGDPAAQSTDEVILTYPAFMAIGTHRLAHKLFKLGISLVPRIMSEYAHRRTGIDIHPGATIGPWFFIDHGTGVVIGETTTIGEHVKLYQHVTIGAKSFDVGDDGTLVKGIKRHPDIGNNVIIYAGATILGGSTVIGDNAVIGGNVWLTHSVAAGDTILAEAPVLRHKLK